MNEEPRRVLLVEDDEDLSQAIADQLTDDGFEVVQCYDGVRGFEVGRDGAFDLIVLDIMLPKRNGFSVCQDLRAAGVATPLLMLTAKDGEWDEVEGLQVGADDFLRKPFERSVLLARLHALLRRQEMGRLKPVQLGSLVVNLSTRHVTVRGADIKLTPREYRLLEFLVSNAEQPVTKSEILQAVWGDDFQGDPNVVEVYVGYLRRKLDVGQETSVIRTVRGVGYTITPRD